MKTQNSSTPVVDKNTEIKKIAHLLSGKAKELNEYGEKYNAILNDDSIPWPEELSHESAVVTLPHIIDYLTAKEIQTITFVRPTFDNKNLVEMHSIDSSSSPAARIFSVRTINLDLNTVIPFHRHEKKEKVYINLTNVKIEFLIFTNVVLKKYSLDYKGQSLTVPPMTSHSVLFMSSEDTKQEKAELLVVISSQDGSDIEWEEGVEKLLENKHLM